MTASSRPESQKIDPPPQNDPRWAVVVIGGGPAGMMAAISAATTLREKGSSGKVLLLEKNDRPGRKLLLTGNGRCNVTNKTHAGESDHGPEDVRFFCDSFGRQGRFLMSALGGWGIGDTIGFFDEWGLGMKTESKGRVFPATETSAHVLDALVMVMEQAGVTVQYNARVVGFDVREDISEDKQNLPNISVVNVEQQGKHWAIRTRAVILATGGKSYPVTGSSGDGYDLASELGHTISPLRPGLVSLRIEEKWIGELQGVSIGGAGVIVLRGEKKLAKGKGEILFTHDGLSGPVILNITRDLGGAIDIETKGGQTGALTIRLDLLPWLDHQELDRKLQHQFMANGDRMAGNCLEGFVPRKVAHRFVKLAGIENRWKINTITREQRMSLIKLLKGLELSVSGHGGWDKAMITVGGISLKEIDPRTMGSKKVGNLFFAGEIIDIDGPTGGYNLQVCWSTGHLAGRSAVERSINR